MRRRLRRSARTARQLHSLTPPPCSCSQHSPKQQFAITGKRLLERYLVNPICAIGSYTVNRQLNVLVRVQYRLYLYVWGRVQVRVLFLHYSHATWIESLTNYKPLEKFAQVKSTECTSMKTAPESNTALS